MSAHGQVQLWRYKLSTCTTSSSYLHLSSRLGPLHCAISSSSLSCYSDKQTQNIVFLLPPSGRNCNCADPRASELSSLYLEVMICVTTNRIPSFVKLQKLPVIKIAHSSALKWITGVPKHDWPVLLESPGYFYFTHSLWELELRNNRSVISWEMNSILYLDKGIWLCQTIQIP